MTLSQIAGEDDIIAKLKEIPGVDILMGEYTPDGYVPKVDKATGIFKPYITVRFEPPQTGYDPGIADPSWDTQRASFTTFIVSPGDRITRDLRDQVRQKLLISFQPSDGSFLRPRSGFTFVDPDLGFHRYVQAIGFSYTFNLSPDAV